MDYLHCIPEADSIQEESSYPLKVLDFKIDLKDCCHVDEETPRTMASDIDRLCEAGTFSGRVKSFAVKSSATSVKLRHHIKAHVKRYNTDLAYAMDQMKKQQKLTSGIKTRKLSIQQAFLLRNQLE